MKKCKHCGSEFVCWNWIHTGFWKTWKLNFWYNNKFPYFRWKFWKFFDRWGHECWNCNNVIQTLFKVKNGISIDKLHSDFIYLPKHRITDIDAMLWHAINQTKYYKNTDQDKECYATRRKMLHEYIDTFLDEQWKLDHNENKKEIKS